MMNVIIFHSKITCEKLCCTSHLHLPSTFTFFFNINKKIMKTNNYSDKSSERLDKIACIGNNC